MLSMFHYDSKQSDEDFWNSISGNGFTLRNDKKIILEEALGKIIKPQDGVLDLMCGVYSYVKADMGIDISEDFLLKNPNIKKFLIWDINKTENKIPLNNNSYNVILMVSGIAYIRNFDYLFKEANRIIKPNGLFIIVYDHHQNSKGTDFWFNLNDYNRLKTLQQYYINNGFHNNGLKRPNHEILELNETHKFKSKASNKHYIVYSSKN
jgi:SAM-dependent methyltransferase